MQVPLERIVDPMARLLIFYAKESRHPFKNDFFLECVGKFNEGAEKKGYRIETSFFKGYHCTATASCEGDRLLDASGRLNLFRFVLSFIKDLLARPPTSLDFERGSFRILAAGIIGEVLGIDHLREDPVTGFKKLTDRKHLKNPEDFWKKLANFHPALVTVVGQPGDDRRLLEFVTAVRERLDQEHYQEHLAAILMVQEGAGGTLLCEEFRGFVQTKKPGEKFYKALSVIWDGLGGRSLEEKQKKFSETVLPIIQILKEQPDDQFDAISQSFWGALLERETPLSQRKPAYFIDCLRRVIAEKPPLLSNTEAAVAPKSWTVGKTSKSQMRLILQNMQQAEKAFPGIFGEGVFSLERTCSNEVKCLAREEELALLELAVDVYGSHFLKQKVCPDNVLAQALGSVAVGVLQVQVKVGEKLYSVDEILKALLLLRKEADAQGFLPALMQIFTEGYLFSGLLSIQKRRLLNTEFLETVQGNLSVVDPGRHLLLPSFLEGVPLSLFFTLWDRTRNHTGLIKRLCLPYGWSADEQTADFSKKIATDVEEFKTQYQEKITAIETQDSANRIVNGFFLSKLNNQVYFKHENDVNETKKRPLCLSLSGIVLGFSGCSSGSSAFIELMKGLIAENRSRKISDPDAYTYRLFRLAVSMILGIPEDPSSTKALLTIEGSVSRKESERIDNTSFVRALRQVAESLCDEAKAKEFINVVFGKMTHEDAGIWLLTAVGLGPESFKVCFTGEFVAHVQAVPAKERKAFFQTITWAWQCVQKSRDGVVFSEQIAQATKKSSSGVVFLSDTHTAIRNFFSAAMREDSGKAPEGEKEIVSVPFKKQHLSTGKRLLVNVSEEFSGKEEGDLTL